MICMEEDGMKRVLFKLILPMAFIVIWLDMCYWICLGENGMNWLQFWIMGGFPFGIQKMLVLLIPRNFGIAGSIGVLALDAIIGGMIGVIVLAIKIIAIIRPLINDFLRKMAKFRHQENQDVSAGTRIRFFIDKPAAMISFPRAVIKYL